MVLASCEAKVSLDSTHFNLIYRLWVLASASFGVAVCSLYIIYDTQLIIGGKHKRCAQLSIDEYIYAAMILYLDIMRMFLELLRLLGAARS